MARIKIVHKTEYTYRNPVGLLRHRLMLRPDDSHDLRLHRAELKVELVETRERNIEDGDVGFEAHRHARGIGADDAAAENHDARGRHAGHTAEQPPPHAIRPLYVRDERRIAGLVWLLLLALRVLVLVEQRVRQALAERNQELTGLNPASRTQTTTQPTSERILKAFKNLTRSQIELGGDVRGVAQRPDSIARPQRQPPIVDSDAHRPLESANQR